ncbi:MAG: DEAD/DEAH box helicase [Polyangiaceae bacterium]|jgi:superfamily II DNA or RNA helicase|nr:DEAD/DEAH box helicase [Polyangiaceae bacterium]
MTQVNYGPGSLIRARGREWIVLTGSDAETLRVRPVSGSEDDQTLIHIALEADPVTPASFPSPDPRQKASHDSALLLRDALLLSLRRGAGPFRGFGQIAVEPRAYQLVPLLMALKQDPVRLLIADDVGVGKTIEGALIARELLDRGDIERFTVLCPPHLVDQWATELEARFHIRAVPVTAANARRLENRIPPGQSIFTVYPQTVVSLDYIKSQNRRDLFLHTCPEFVIVDEAHTCAASGQGRHQRYELLKGLTELESRHLVLLTATPHSGDESAFFRLLGLLDREFQRLKDATGDERTRLREKLSRYFVQRRRPDIAEWKEGNLFPKRETKELTYKLTGQWEKFFESVLDYCAAIVEAAGGDQRRQRMNFWGTLALMRCAASSPVAAVSALRTRAGLDTGEEEREALLDRIFDGTSDSLPDDDVEPPAANDDPALAALIAQAEELAGQSGDPKLKLLTDHVNELLAEGFSPVVFCRYIATAHYLGRHLAGKLKGVVVEVVTGEITSEERKEKVDALGEADRRLLIATDCLSEGINLQELFDAVVHYDLSWNPTRHEQREGRVDRFGQERPVVRATLIYGANNPVDGAVLDVILRKAAKIREELGVPVPLPDDGHTLSQALLQAVMLRRRKKERTQQMAFDFMELEPAKQMDARWQDVAEKAKKNRTIFAQRRLKPDEVLPEWHKTLAAVGGREDVQRFTERALARLGSGLEALKGGYKAPLGALPEDVRERLESEGLTGVLRIDFTYPPAPRCRPVQRSHPLVSVLADTLLERTLGNGVEEPGADPGVLGRVGCWISPVVRERTVVALLRLRHQLVSQKGGRSSTLLVEEATALAWSGSSGALVEGTDALALLAPKPMGDPAAPARERFVTQAVQQLEARFAQIDAFGSRRAQALLADHRRVREAADARGTYNVKALLPADVIGLYVLLPQVS